MNFHDLRSIISSEKSKFKMENASPSFQVSANITRRYIEPSFTKADGFFDVEQPTFLLISAVGASGKSMLSMKLSLDTGLPLLDLGLHAPVAAHAMTGLITTSYANTDLSAVFSAIKGGEFGVIIDGLDEGLSKAGEKPFEAFLDDLLQLSRGSPRTSFVLVGRTKTVEDCWLYLAAKGATTGLASLDPFNLDKAREYIDTFANPPLAGQRQSYIQSRDLILSKLSDAFSQEGDRFLSFVGYPPVLDAVATLLDGEKNYHRLSTEVGGGDRQGDREESPLEDYRLHHGARESRKGCPATRRTDRVGTEGGGPGSRHFLGLLDRRTMRQAGRALSGRTRQSPCLPAARAEREV